MNVFNIVEEYMECFPKNVQLILQNIRSTIKKIAPETEEFISYGMSAYKYFGMLVHFAAFKNHIGFYATPTGHKTFEKELSNYKQGKGSVQFPIDKPMPIALITRIVEYRMKENLTKQLLNQKKGKL